MNEPPIPTYLTIGMFFRAQAIFSIDMGPDPWHTRIRFDGWLVGLSNPERGLTQPMWTIEKRFTDSLGRQRVKDLVMFRFAHQNDAEQMAIGLDSLLRILPQVDNVQGYRAIPVKPIQRHRFNR